MTAFREFALELRYPPNPIRELDKSLRDPGGGAPNEFDGEALSGSQAIPGPATDGVGDCQLCHVRGASAGHFGTSGETTPEGLSQVFKVPHLRNLYQKVGFSDFGTLAPPMVRSRIKETRSAGPASCITARLI